MTEARLQELESLLCECAANARDHRAGDAVDEICDELRAMSPVLPYATEPPVDLSQLSDDELEARVTALWDRQLAAQQLERDLEAALVATETEQEKRTRCNPP